MVLFGSYSSFSPTFINYIYLHWQVCDDPKLKIGPPLIQLWLSKWHVY